MTKLSQCPLGPEDGVPLTAVCGYMSLFENVTVPSLPIIPILMALMYYKKINNEEY